MDDDNRELVTRLFTLATVILETAHAAAAGGQSPCRDPSDYAARADTLRQAARNLVAIADTITVVTGGPGQPGTDID